MAALNYYLHYILNSRYLLIINTIIVFFIFIIIKEGHYAFCMNDTNIPNIAEPKIPVVRGIQILTPLQMEVSKFLGYTETIQQQEQIISEQQEQINRLASNQEIVNRIMPFLQDNTFTQIHEILNSYIQQNDLINDIFNNQGVERFILPDGRSRIVLSLEELDRINNRLTEQHNRISRLTNDNLATNSLSWWFFGIAFLGYYSAWAFYGISPLKLFLGPIKW